jgi:hypothetical protein
MRIITGFLFLLNVAFWVGFDAICWFFTGGTFGWTVLIGLIIFLIAWGISIEATIAPLDYFMQSEWGIFTKKIKWANSTSLIGMGIFTFICIIFDLLQMREFLNIKIF